MTPVALWHPIARGAPTLILHPSVALAWSFLGNANTYPSDVLWRMPLNVPAVPLCWSLQVAEALLAAELRGSGTRAQVDNFLAGLHSFPFFVDGEMSARAWSHILPLARAYSLPVYDAAYLELALRLKLPLATIDPNLTRTAANVGVPIFTP